MKTVGNKYIPIYSLKMANYLIRNGYDMQRVSMNYNNTSYCVFEFIDTTALRQTMSLFKRRGA
ncbi:DUF5659 domain-containing protein [Caproiciproducens sp. CPB-2]|uniref:DUF5659 domain-containing protein n=1 Tax=Caproiciproducens sp. CPB-2 TaxID=3030017 RepID=UPI003FA42229